MKYLLDTNICIYIIKQRPDSVLKKFRSLVPGDLVISSITIAELQYGVEKSQFAARNQAALEEFLLPLDIAYFDSEAAIQYGKIRAGLEKKGRIIGSMDLLIAAHGVSLGIPIVTHNVKEFSRVPGLTVENWA